MNRQQDPRSGFEEELLVQLKGMVAERGAALDSEAGTARTSTPAWRRSPRLFAGGAVATAATVTALFVSAGGAGTAPAYAVEPQSNGEVSVQINDLREASALEAALEQAGIPADVTYLPEGMACSRTGVEAPAGPGNAFLIGHINADGVSDGPLTFKVDPHLLGPDQTLVLTATAASQETSIAGANLQLQVATGKVGPCDPVPAA